MTDMSVYVLSVGSGNTAFQTISNMEKDESMNVESAGLIKCKVKCAECDFQYLGNEEESYWAAVRHGRDKRHLVNRFMCIGDIEI